MGTTSGLVTGSKGRMAQDGFLDFELDLMEAVKRQLLPALAIDKLPPALLTQENIDRLPNTQGLYILRERGNVRYIGKTSSDSGLKERLSRHRKKVRHRKGINPDDITYQAVHV